MTRYPHLERLAAAASTILLALTLAACGDSRRRAGTEWQAVYDTIGDTIVVRTVAGSVWGDSAELVEDLRIGRFEGPDEYMFGRVRSLAVASDGSIYVFDSQAPALRKYAADGTYLATFGREGGGPGEYKRPDGGLAVLPDGRVLLRDPANNRISVYGPDGGYLDGWRIRGRFNTSRPLFVDSAGSSYTLLLLDPQAELSDWRFGLARFDPDGTPRDTIPAPSFDFQPAELVAKRVDGDDWSISSESVPFTPTVSWTLSPLGYIVGAVATRYALDLFIAADRVLRIERGNWEPVPVLAAEKAEQERILTAIMRQTDPGWRWNGDAIPDTKPPFVGVFVGQRGRVWVWLHRRAHRVEAEGGAEEARPGEIPTQTWREPVAFDVFEPDGRYLGRVLAPEGFQTRPWPVIRGDTIWAVVQDALEVPYVARFHIRHPDKQT